MSIASILTILNARPTFQHLKFVRLGAKTPVGAAKHRAISRRRTRERLADRKWRGLTVSGKAAVFNNFATCIAASTGISLDMLGFSSLNKESAHDE